MKPLTHYILFYRVIFGNWYSSFDYHSGIINHFDTKVDSKFYWTWPILKLVLILFLALNLTEICKYQLQKKKNINISTQKWNIFQKLNLVFWLIFSSYCFKFFQICHPNIFYSITNGDNNNLNKIWNMVQEKEQNKISIA